MSERGSHSRGGAEGGREGSAFPEGRDSITPADVERASVEALGQQERAVLGMRSRSTIANEDAGGIIVFEGQIISEEVLRGALDAGKLNELLQAAYDPAPVGAPAASMDLRAREIIGRMAGRTIHGDGGEVIISQGDVVTEETVGRARGMGLLDLLLDAVEEPGG